MIEIEKPRIETLDLTPDGRYGKFTLEPLEGGYGTTLGNSLRRVLLSSLQGVAVTSVKIDGVQHEFTTIPYVKEDVTEIILNLKGLTAKFHSDGEKTVYIEAEGPCVVTGASIKSDSEVEILNPELYIATIDEGGKLIAEITIDKGRGYVPAEKNKPEHNVIGMIPVDSIYTPVVKANYFVENTRVGQQIDYDKLTLEVWTNGTISAKEAVSMSAKILTEHLNLFADLAEDSSINVGFTEDMINFYPSAPYGNDWSNKIREGQSDTVLGGWSGSVLDPFGLTDLYTNPSKQYDAAWYDATKVELTINVPVGGEKKDVTMTLKQWSDVLNGTATTVDGVEYNYGSGQADIETRLDILAACEGKILESYNYLPMLQDGSMALLSQQVFYVIEEYNPILGRGGLTYTKYNYNEADWEAYVKAQGGELKY